jgi:PHD/YefM family antitoxin component YafN of YafNO toxin-antitoxin module
MKRAILFLFIAFVFSGPSFSQAYESSITYGKKKQKTITIDYAYPQEAVQNAIVQKIEKLGHAGKEEKGLFNKDKGFIVFKDAFVTDINEERMDYILKIERKSRRDKDETTLYLVLNKGGEDAISAMSAHDIGRAKMFLNNLLPEIEEANLELEIKSQDDAVVKSEKKFKDLQDEKAELEKKLKKNAEDIENQQKQIESQRTTLEGLKGKRKVVM